MINLINKPLYLLDLKEDFDDNSISHIDYENAIMFVSIFKHITKMDIDEVGRLYHGPDGSVRFSLETSVYVFIVNFTENTYDFCFYHKKSTLNIIRNDNVNITISNYENTIKQIHNHIILLDLVDMYGIEVLPPNTGHVLVDENGVEKPLENIKDLFKFLQK